MASYGENAIPKARPCGGGSGGGRLGWFCGGGHGAGGKYSKFLGMLWLCGVNVGANFMQRENASIFC
ncbi:hypothetical protein R83H12_02568 [Fibrobacteria bacterium R8-3-H12]